MDRFLDRLTEGERALEADAARLSRFDQTVFLARLVLLVLIAWAVWKSGASRMLADSLRAVFSGTFAWPLTHVVLVALCILAYEAVLFPLIVLQAVVCPDEDGGVPAGWLGDCVKSVLYDTVFGTAVAIALYALMWFMPRLWWLAATGFYAVFIVGLGVWGPSLILPRVTATVPLRDPGQMAALRAVGKAAGLDIVGCARWEPPDDHRFRVILAGTGARRRVLFDAALEKSAAPGELLFLAARRMAGHKGGHDILDRAVEILLAAAVFFGMDRWMAAFSSQRGIRDFFQPEVFPVWICILFGFAAAGGLALNYLRRRADLRRDTFAMARAGGGEALLGHLLAEFRRSAFPYRRAWWEIPFFDTPDPATRLRHAERLGFFPSPAPPSDRP